jgi:hypothetical protein
MRRFLTAGLLLVAAACSGSAGYTERTDPPGATDPTTDAPPAPTAAEPGDVPEAGDVPEPGDVADASGIELPDGDAIVDGVANDLIVVYDQDGGADALASYRADGTLVATYSTDDGGSIWQPIWSPDGRRLAWASSTDGQRWELVTAAVDGGDRTTHALPGRPDYIAYDPTASRVLALTPSAAGFGLAIVEVEQAGEPFTVIDLGRPYYSDFSPAGDRLIAHVAADMKVIDVAGSQQALDLASTTHQTPAWHPTENRVFFTTDSGAGARIVSHDLDTGVTTDLAGAALFVFFDLDPSGSKLAVAAFGDPVEQPGGTSALRRAASPADATPLSTGLWIVGADGAVTQLDDQPASSPAWDPSGTRVLARDGLAGPGRWRVFDADGQVAATDEIDVDGSLLPAYLPYWDQYGRSLTLWSPDGTRFVHAGTTADGRSGVWIHDASTSGPSTFLVEGDIGLWSPT